MTIMISNFYSYRAIFLVYKRIFSVKNKHCDRRALHFLYAEYSSGLRCRKSGINRARSVRRARYALFAADTIRRRRQNRSNFRKIAMSRRSVRAKGLRRTMTGAMGRCAGVATMSLFSSAYSRVTLPFRGVESTPVFTSHAARREWSGGEERQSTIETLIPDIRRNGAAPLPQPLRRFLGGMYSRAPKNSLEFRSRVLSMAEPRFGRSLLLDSPCPFIVRALKTASQVRHKCAVRSFWTQQKAEKIQRKGTSILVK